MISVKKLFSFSEKEVAFFFAHTRVITVHNGLKLYKLKPEFLPAIMAVAPASQHGKLLIITPRKSGNATERNLFRRRVKALFYEEGWHKQQGYYALYAYKEGVALSYNDLKTWLTKHLGSI